MISIPTIVAIPLILAVSIRSTSTYDEMTMGSDGQYPMPISLRSNPMAADQLNEGGNNTPVSSHNSINRLNGVNSTTIGLD